MNRTYSPYFLLIITIVCITMFIFGCSTNPTGGGSSGVRTYNLTILTTTEVVTTEVYGIVNISPEGSVYLFGATVEITASAESAYVFDHWGQDISGETNPISLVMDGNKTIEALFRLFGSRQYVLDYTISPLTKGTVTLDPPGGLYVEGTTVNLLASPEFAYEFDHWSGALSGYSNPSPLYINNTKEVTASFIYKPWVDYGGSYISEDEANFLCLYVTGETPYVAFQDAAHSYKLSIVKCYSSTSEYVGDPGFSDQRVMSSSLGYYNGTLYVAYEESTVDYNNFHSNGVYVKKFNGSSWVDLAPGKVSTFFQNPKLFVYSGTPYLVGQNGVSQVYIMKFNGTSWEAVGNDWPIVMHSDYHSIYVYNGTPYVAFRDNDNGIKMTVIKYDGSSWEVVGYRAFSANQVHFPSLYVHDGTPYVAYTDYDDSFNGGITVMKYTGTTWECVGARMFVAETNVYYPYLCFNDDTPYIGMSSAVYKYDGANWEPVDALSTVGGELFISDGYAYVAFPQLYSRAKVNKYLFPL